MEARLAENLPKDAGRWQYEPKWDGFRCLAFKSFGTVELRGKSGKSLGRFFPEVVSFLEKVPARQFVLDGELVIERNGRFDFDALQMRLHPAESRIRRLAEETPARMIVFDMLVDKSGNIIMPQPLRDRRSTLETFMKGAAVSGRLVLSP